MPNQSTHFIQHNRNYNKVININYTSEIETTQFTQRPDNRPHMLEEVLNVINT